MIDVLMVVYRPREEDWIAVLNSLDEASRSGVALALHVRHNDGAPPTTGAVATVYARHLASGLLRTLCGDDSNPGFGVATNELAQLSAADGSPFLLVLNQDAIPEPESIAHLLSVAQRDAADVAAWEMRQIPFEHPKSYDPVTLDTEWVSGAAVLLRREAFSKVNGFEPRIFMYGEDVDLSWRLRVAGFRLRYVARAAVVHRTYAYADEMKPLQSLEGIYANLALRTRFSGRRQVLQGLGMAVGELLIPQPFEGRRRGILRAMWKFLRNYGYFRETRQGSATFEPRFAGWGFELRRDGAFHEFKSSSEQPTNKPLISVLVRTHKRGGFLRQALTTISHQTHRPIEIVVVEDGSDEGQSVCAEFRDAGVDIQYHRLNPAAGRSVAGNRAMEVAHGEWFCFLDDDDQFFADHLEVLLDVASTHKLLGAFSLSWRTRTEVLDPSKPHYLEHSFDRIPDEPFNRVAMWHHNLMPIQAVLFHRSLFERYGGFEVDMHQLEDWNLWTRYTLIDDFVQVRKLTSKYRVPATDVVSVERQMKLDEAYADAVRRQQTLKFQVTPQTVRELAEAYAKSNALLHVSADRVRSGLLGSRWGRRLFALRTRLKQSLRARLRSNG